jgi:hypothetical protein
LTAFSIVEQRGDIDPDEIGRCRKGPVRRPVQGLSHRRFWLRPLRLLGATAVTTLEALYPTPGIHELLLPRVERMALIAKLGM